MENKKTKVRIILPGAGTGGIFYLGVLQEILNTLPY